MKNDTSKAMGETIAADRALAVLRLLNGPLRGAGNDRLLRNLLDQCGLTSSYQDIAATIETLERAGAVTSTRMRELTVATLTRRGADIAEGRTDAAGVATPGPECPY